MKMVNEILTGLRQLSSNASRLWRNPVASVAGSMYAAQTQYMADGINQIRLIHCIEMEIPHAHRMQHLALFGGGDGGDDFARFRILIQRLERMVQMIRDFGVALAGEFRDLGKIVNRQNARHHRHIYSRLAHAIQETHICRRFKKELRDRPIRARIDFFS